MALDGGEIPVSVYTNLIDTVHEHMELMHRYVALRKKALKVSELHMYDLYAPMVEEFEMKVPFAQAKEIVKKGLAPLGEAYGRFSPMEWRMAGLMYMRMKESVAVRIPGEHMDAIRLC